MKLKTTYYVGLHCFLVLICTISNALAIEAVYEGGDGILAQVFVNCVGCHSSGLSGGSRNGAPSSVNFDTYNAAVNSGSRAVSRGTAGTMPPGGVNALNNDQKSALLAWQSSGFPRIPATNSAPTANAGQNQSINEESAVALNGSGSDNEDGNNVSFSWQQTGGQTVVLQNSNSAQPSFTAPSVEGSNEILTFVLTVTDSKGLTATAMTTVSVSDVITENQPPVADAGQNQTVEEALPVSLSGIASDNEDGSNVSFSWLQTGGGIVTLQNSNSAQASFTAPSVDSGGEILTFVLTVTDSKGLTAISMTTVTVTNTVLTNQPPIANAGNGQTLIEGEQATIDGSESFDAEDGTLLSYHWSQLSGSPVLLSSTMGSTSSFTIPEIITPSETLTFQLIVTDPDGQSNSNTDTNTVLVTVIKKNADFFQHLTALNAVILDTSIGEITEFDSATFNSALITDGQIVINNQLTESQSTFIASRIGVSEQHLDQPAELLIVAAYTPRNGKKIFFQKNSDEQFEPWDTNFNTLQPYRNNIELEMIYDLSVYSGPLLKGDYELYLGYRLADGSVVFNGEAHIFNVK